MELYSGKDGRSPDALAEAFIGSPLPSGAGAGDAAREGMDDPGGKTPAQERLEATLKEGVRGVLTNEGFKNWLSTSHHYFWNKYTFRNALLVYLQRPDAREVMGFETWKQYGRQVRPLTDKERADGAHIGINIWKPVMYKGGTSPKVISTLNSMRRDEGGVAHYRIGTNGAEFTYNGSLYGYVHDGREILKLTKDELRGFIDKNIVGKIPERYVVQPVFDVRDTMQPDTLEVARGTFTKDEAVLDENGNPVVAKRGKNGEPRYFEINNTEERKARFKPHLDLRVSPLDDRKTRVFLNACEAAAKRKGTDFVFRGAADDEHFKGGPEDSPRGYFDSDKNLIVINSDFDIAEQAKTAVHEMTHGDLDSLSATAERERKGEQRKRGEREVCAEATAFATCNAFGIETGGYSFAYIAAWAGGLEAQDLEKNLKQIFSESQTLMKDIRAELELKGYNIALEETDPAERQPLSREAASGLCGRYAAFVIEQDKAIDSIEPELEDYLSEHASSEDAAGILAEKQTLLACQRSDAQAIRLGISALENVTGTGQGIEGRKAQEAIIENIEAAKARIARNGARFSDLSMQFVEAVNRAKPDSRRQDFITDPENTLAALARTNSCLGTLSPAQTRYIAKSEYIAKNTAKLLKTDEKAFCAAAAQRAGQAVSVAAGNGTFVEFASVQKFGSVSVTPDGTLCHPKVAEAIVSQGEQQMRSLKAQAEALGERAYPAAKCVVVVYSPTEAAGGLSAVKFSNIELGSGEQVSLSDYMAKAAGRSQEKAEVLDNFKEAQRERGANSKISVPEIAAREPAASRAMPETPYKTQTRWQNGIGQARDAEAEKEAKADENAGQNHGPHREQ
jgi:hypothetical protein